MKKFLKKIRWKLIGKTFLLILLIGALTGTAYVANVFSKAPNIEEKMLQSYPTSNMYDKDGNLIWSDTEHRRDYITYKEIPQTYVDILTSVEDKEYFTSNGYSVKGLFNAGYSLVKEKLGKGKARGGSTLEQQLIKNTAFSTNEKDRTIDRKIKEVWLSTQLDKNFSKEQILEWYINKIDMGENSFGANTVMMTYYGVSLKDMKEKTPENISKIATIVGLGQAPGFYNLYANKEATQERRNIVLKTALDNQKITQEEYDKAIAIPVDKDLQPRFWRNKEVSVSTKEHNAFIFSTLEQIKNMGYDITQTPMQIHTSLDSKLNSYVKQQFDTYTGYKDKDQQIASTIIDNVSGNVVAQYGGRNTEAFGINRANQRTRSTGSAIKPFLDYGPAIEFLGWGSGQRLDSSPYRYPGTNVTATNYGGVSYGIVDMKFALKLSLNTPANRTLDQFVGSNYAKQYMKALDLDVKDTYGGSDALGLDLSTADIANGMSTYANLGNHSKTNYINKLVFSDNSELKVDNERTQTIKKSTAYVLLKMLENVPKSDGTAPNAQIPSFSGYAVKTGTVAFAETRWGRPDMSSSDNWIAGTTKNYAMAVWTGYDRPQDANGWIPQSYKGHEELFKRIMIHINTGKDTSDWQKPDTVRQQGSDYYPTDVKVERYYIPGIEAFKIPNFVENFTNKILDNIKDGGIKEYKLPDDYKEQEQWRNKVDDKTLLGYWENNMDVVQALRKKHSIYIS